MTAWEFDHKRYQKIADKLRKHLSLKRQAMLFHVASSVIHKWYNGEGGPNASRAPQFEALFAWADQGFPGLHEWISAGCPPDNVPGNIPIVKSVGGRRAAIKKTSTALVSAPKPEIYDDILLDIEQYTFEAKRAAFQHALNYAAEKAKISPDKARKFAAILATTMQINGGFQGYDIASLLK